MRSAKALAERLAGLKAPLYTNVFAICSLAGTMAQQVVDITNISFRAGAATNIEVIDAERSVRDADIGVAVAEDQLRRAKLELLNALGRFP